MEVQQDRMILYRESTSAHGALGCNTDSVNGIEHASFQKGELLGHDPALNSCIPAPDPVARMYIYTPVALNKGLFQHLRIHGSGTFRRRKDAVC